jgi:hypothetical protein
MRFKIEVFKLKKYNYIVSSRAQNFNRNERALFSRVLTSKATPQKPKKFIKTLNKMRGFPINFFFISYFGNQNF